jgi:hypothetical protein
MKAILAPDGNLVIMASDEELDALREMDATERTTDNAMYDAMEHLTCKSEYGWASPLECGALTDAPILCTRDEAGEVEQAWGFMDYQVISVLDQLLNYGKAVFIRG